MSEIAGIKSSADELKVISTSSLDDSFLHVSQSNISGNYDFTGIGDPTSLCEYIKTLVNGLNENFKEYNTKSDIYKSLKGETAEKAKSYVDKIGNLISSFSNYYLTFSTLACKAYAQMQKDDINNAKTIEVETDRISKISSLILDTISESAPTNTSTGATSTGSISHVSQNEDSKKVLYRSGATVLNALTGVGLGAVGFVESAADAGLIASTTMNTPVYLLCDGVGFIYSKITGNEYNSLTKAAWNNTKTFVATNYTSKLSDLIYDETAYGNYLHNSYSYENVKDISYGVGETGAIVAASLLTCGVAGVGAGAGAAGTAAVSTGASQAMTTALTAFGAINNFGKGGQEAYADGASTLSGLAYATAKGIQGGAEWYLGGTMSNFNSFNKIGANIATRVGFDIVDGGSAPIIDSALKGIYNDKTYAENFQETGGWKAVGTSALVATIGSTAGEGVELGKAANSLKMYNDLGKNFDIKDVTKYDSKQYAKMYADLDHYVNKNTQNSFQDSLASNIANDMKNFNHQQIVDVYDHLDDSTKNLSRGKSVDIIYTDAKVKANTDYYDFFKNFREHGEGHTELVAEYAVGIANQAGLSDQDTKDVNIAGKTHDLGMEGGKFKDKKGIYHNVDDLVETDRFEYDENGVAIKRVYQADGVDAYVSNIAKDGETLSSVKANLARKNHPLNSGVDVLKKDLSQDGADNEVVALLTVSHSKSTSGIVDFSSAEQWNNTIESLTEAANVSDGTLNADEIANSLREKIGISYNSETKIVEIVDNDKFTRIQDKALALRDGDAMAKIAMKDGKQTMQTGNYTELEQYRVADQDHVPTFIDKGDCEAKHIKDIVVDENGNKLYDVDNEFSIKTHAGELNTSYSSTYTQARDYTATIDIIDPLASPGSSLDSAFERIGEVATYGNVNSRKVTINIAIDEGSNLANWYNEQLDVRKLKLNGDINSKYASSTKDFIDKNVVINFTGLKK